MKMRSFVITGVVSALFIMPVPSFAKVGGGDVEYTPKGAGKVVFQHEYHVKLKGMRCNGCHYKPFQMSTGSYRMKMDTLTKGQFCGLCHNGKDGFDLVSRQNCKRCHQE